MRATLNRVDPWLQDQAEHQVVPFIASFPEGCTWSVLRGAFPAKEPREFLRKRRHKEDHPKIGTVDTYLERTPWTDRGLRQMVEYAIQKKWIESILLEDGTIVLKKLQAP